MGGAVVLSGWTVGALSFAAFFMARKPARPTGDLGEVRLDSSEAYAVCEFVCCDNVRVGDRAFTSYMDSKSYMGTGHTFAVV